MSEPPSMTSAAPSAERADKAESAPPLTQQPSYHQRPGSATPPIMSGAPLQPGDHGVLLSRLRAQVEFYFSPQNLARDTYLRNMLASKSQDEPSPTARLMAPIGVITNFPKVRDICASFGRSLPEPPPALLARALEGSVIVTISADGAWIGPASQQLPPLGTMGQPPRGPIPQAHFEHAAYPPHPHQQRLMVPQPPPVHHHSQDGAVSVMHQPMPFSGPTQNAPQSLGSESPSSHSLESSHSQRKDLVLVVISDLPADTDQTELLSAFTSETVKPKSASAEGNNTWIVAFGSESDAKAAIRSSGEKTIAGTPIRAKLKSELTSSKVSIASASGASLSSMSDPQQQRPGAIPGAHPGAGPQMVQPAPLHGPMMGHPSQGAYPLPQSSGSGPQLPSVSVGSTPSPREMYPPQNAIPSPGGPPYPPAPHYAMPPVQVVGMPSQHFSPYYTHQQMQQVHTYYLQQQAQQQIQPYNPPPPHPMGVRYGGGLPPPPPPRYSGPGAIPSMPYPYQGIQQYVMGDGYGPYHGHPLRQQGHIGSMRGAGGGGGTGGQDGSGKKKSEQGNKKKKNRNQKRDSMASAGGSDSEGNLRRNRNHDNHGQMNSHSESSLSMNVLSHGESRGKGKSKKGDYGDLRRTYGGSSSSFSRHQKSNKMSNSSSNNSRGDNKTEHGSNREIFSAADFPGLGGNQKPIEQPEGKPKHQGITGQKMETKKLYGYADALLKKNAKESETVVETNNHIVSKAEVDSITRQTEAMEREILSEFHDLSIIGDSRTNSAENQGPQHNSAGGRPDNIPVSKQQVPPDSSLANDATASSSVDGPSKHSKSNDLPILPREHFLENDDFTASESSPDSASKAPNDDGDSKFLRKAEPEVNSILSQNEQLSPPKESNPVPPLPHTVDMNAEKSKPPGAWGSKRLFADVIKERD